MSKRENVCIQNTDLKHKHPAVEKEIQEGFHHKLE